MAETQPASSGPDQLALVAFIAVVLLGGGNAIGVKQTVQELAPFWGAAMRFAAAGLLTATLVMATRRPMPRGSSLWGAALYGVVGIGVFYGLGYAAIRDVPAGTFMVLIALTPLFTFGLAILHGQERFRLQGLIGALIAVVGVGIVFIDQLSADVPLLPLLMVLLGAAAVGESAVIVKWIPRSDPFVTNAVAMLAGTTLLFAVSLLISEPLTLPSTRATWAAVGYLVVGGSVAMFALFVFTIQRWTASAVSYVTLLMPLVTMVLAFFFFGERISVSFLVGSGVIIAGVYVGAFLKHRPAPTTSTSLPECVPVDAGAPEPVGGATAR